MATLNNNNCTILPKFITRRKLIKPKLVCVNGDIMLQELLVMGK